MRKLAKSGTRKKSIAVDFDGVVHRYSRGWRDGSIYDRPMPGARGALAALHNEFKIVIFTRRAASQGKNGIKRWLKQHHIPYDRITSVKPLARWYVDDRAIRFTNWNETIREIRHLERYYPFAKRK